MENRSLEQQEKRYGGRRKRLRRFMGLILFITLAVVAVALWASLRRRHTVVNVPVKLPENVNRRDSGFKFTRSEEGREIFTVEAARTFAYGNGSTDMLLEKVHVVIFGRAGGRHDEMTTNRCRYDSATGALACSGDASIKLEAEAGMQPTPNLREPQPLFLETSDVSFNPARSAVTTPNAVRFQFGPASGEAVGLVYNTRSQELALNQDVKLRLPETNADVIDASAGGLTYAKQSNQISLAAPVEVTQGKRRISASGGKVFLDAANRITRVTLTGAVGSTSFPSRDIATSEDNLEADFNPGTNEVRSLQATGHVTAESREKGNQGVRRLKADQVSLALAGARPQPQSGWAQGHVEVLFQNPAHGGSGRRAGGRAALAGGEAGKRILTTQALAFSFQKGGLLQEVHTNGPGTIQLIPAVSGRPRQTVTAGAFRMAFDAAGRLMDLRGLSKVRVVDQPPAHTLRPGKRQKPQPDSLPIVSTSDDLMVKVNPVTGAVETIDQKGHVHFEQGSRKGLAADAFFNEASQTLALSGRPELWDADGRIRADRIQANLAGGIAEGEGHVQSIYFRSPGGAAASEAAGSSTPVVVLAERVTTNRKSEVAHYEGRVRASRGADVVQSPWLDVYRKQQRLIAGGGVVTSLVEPALENAEKDGRSGKNNSQAGAVEPVTITAKQLEYFNQGREAVYQGGVKMMSTGTSFNSDRLQTYFSQPAGSNQTQIERAVADGHVEVNQAPGRRASGDHAEYFAGPGKIVLTGGPPVVYDIQQGYLTGQSLTFFTRNGSLFAGGGEKSKTLSKRRILQQ